MDIRFIRYLFGPVNVVNNICVRKRWFHSGYAILKYNIKMNSFIHVAYTHSLRQTEIYIKNEFNREVKL